MEAHWHGDLNRRKNKMGRPKKTSTDELLCLVEKYFEEEVSGNPEMLKCSLLESYAVKKGICAKAYDFRRNKAVRKKLEELQEAARQEVDRQSAIAYKNLDVDGLLRTCSDLQELKSSLMEADRYWKTVYDTAAELKVQNRKLFSEKIKMESEIRAHRTENDGLDEKLDESTKTINRQQRENRCLKRMLSDYLYPALANELLRQALLPSKGNESVKPEAFEALIDGKIPSPFHGVQGNKPKSMTRQEKLMEQLKNQVCGNEE